MQWAFLLVIALVVAIQAPARADSSDLASLSLEELMDLEVTSVSKTPEKSFQAPAAVYVITAEDIRRSGVTSIPEALRLAPGVEVARLNSNEWAVGIRGFGTRLSRYTLVLIDGRSVYSPLFAGTYWEVQDTMLEDIDRIEVIRGPGGALWGSNAVNGVINIITKNSKRTHGNLASVGGGTEEKDFGSFRHGGAVGPRFNYRLYGKYFDRDSSFSKAGDNFDAWNMGRAGFRTDWDIRPTDSLTVQSDTYGGRAGQRTAVTTNSSPFNEIREEDSDLFGTNMLARWERKTGSSDKQFQAYYDRTRRKDPNFEELRNTYDADFQHSFSAGRRNRLTYGAGYRASGDDTDGGISTTRFTPTSRTSKWWNVFAQDQIAVVPDRLIFTLGSKAEHNNYTGWELQPNGRLAWTPTNRQTLWTAVSRAVRTPSRVDRDPLITFAAVPPPPALIVARYTPNDRFDSEKVVAYELGYRTQPCDSFLATVDGFYNRYDDIQSLNINPLFLETNPPPAKLVFPFIFENKLRGKIYGGELNAVWNLLGWWKLEGIYSYARINLEKKDGATDGVTETSREGSTPRHQAVFKSSMSLRHSVEFDPTVRYVSSVPAQAIPAYWTMDLHVGWHVRENVELAVVGQNLFQPRHGESSENINEIQRGVYGKITLQWN